MKPTKLVTKVSKQIIKKIVNARKREIKEGSIGAYINNNSYMFIVKNVFKKISYYMPIE